MSNRPILICSCLFLMLQLPCLAQDEVSKSVQQYRSAMKKYEQQDYSAAASHFQKYLKSEDTYSEGRLYNGACILALAGQTDQAFETLELMFAQHPYSNVDHISSDSDLESLHQNPRWEAIIQHAKANKSTLPQRTRAKVKAELLEAKRILQAEGGKLWGTAVWSTDILVLDFDNTIYSLEKLPDCKTDDGVIFYKTIPQNTLSFTNSAQEYDNKRYAIVLANYLDDQSSTIIHELFHVLQLKARTFRGDPVNYLDEHEARVLLRLEFQALRNALKSANENDRPLTIRYLADAVSFRKIRQSEFESFLQDELEIETLEGMANYTGIKLSSIENKFLEAIDEINGREAASTYTRPFPYATGPAYGLLFDYLDIEWRSSDMTKIYNFRHIFESNHGDQVVIDATGLDEARSRNNFSDIKAEESQRKEEHERNIAHYTRILISQPTLRAKPSDGDGTYSMSFDMNGTLVLGDAGIVYSHIKGVDISGNNFGNFNSIAGKDQLGVAGILRRKDGEYVFPLPVSIEDRKIVGEHYQIDLNEGWTVKKADSVGGLEIVRESK